MERYYVTVILCIVNAHGRRNRSGRPGGCRTNNLTNKNFYVHCREHEMNKTQVERCIHCGQLILRKISEVDATRCQIPRHINAQNSISAGARPRGLRVNSFYYPTRPVPVGQIFYPTRPAGIPVTRSTRSARPTKIFGLKISEYI